MQKVFTTHNYIDVCEEYPMLRKEAVKVEKRERFCLPFNKYDDIAICIGKGNAEWNYSAPHGAGRIMSRNAAKKDIEIKAFEKSMDDIFSSSVCLVMLDESPQAHIFDSIIFIIIETLSYMLEDIAHPPLYAYLSCKSDTCFLSGLKIGFIHFAL